MKKYLKHYSLVTVLLSIIGCHSKTTSQRISFFEKEQIAITIPVLLNDTLTGKFLFDTGASYDCLIMDSTFCANNPLPAWREGSGQIFFSPHAAWGTPLAEKYRRVYYQNPINVSVANTEMVFSRLIVQNQKLASVEDLQGTISFPRYDSTHVWELNFENNYLEIHKAEDFKKPNNCYWFAFVYDDQLWNNTAHIMFPICITTPNGDTTTINYPYMIDTGSVFDFMLFPSAAEFDFFRKQDNAIQIANPFGGYRNRYDVKARVFEDFEIDSMRIYTDEVAVELGKKEKGIIGLNFLKRFNVFFDFSTNQVGLEPIKNFTRIIDKQTKRFYFSINVTPDQRQFVSQMPENIKNNYYKEAGLQIGDEIIAINGFEVKNMSPENALKIRESATKIINIMRDGKPMEINVHINEIDMRGD